MNNGELTAQVARLLTRKFWEQAEILFDHGDPERDGLDKVGVIRSWFGDKYKDGSLLGDLDIAVIQPHSNQVLLLVEVEESTASPKKLLGDIFATLWSEHLRFQGKRNLEVGRWTTLMVLFCDGSRRDLITFLSSRTNQIKDARLKVVLDTFNDETDLENKLTHQIQDALASHQSQI